MYVIKRSGEKQPLSFDKITNRISNLIGDKLVSLNAVDIAKHICVSVYDGVSTSILDETIAQYCASKVTENDEYQALASIIVVNSHTKNTKSFVETVEILYNSNVVSKEFYDNVLKEDFESMIDYSRDYNIDYFGFKTLERSYLLKAKGVVVERPQHMWMRVAIHIHKDNLSKIKNTYDLLSTKSFIHATPTLFNAGTINANLSSCYLLGMEDSLEGIFECITDCAKISKWAGGIGVHMSNIRSKKSMIHGTGGDSSGIIPLLKMFDATGRFINQGGKRMGSIACYLEPHHADVFDFLDAKKHIGNEEDRARNLFYALWVSDLFMKRVMTNDKWSLFSPSDLDVSLSEVYGQEYEDLYIKYEQQGLYRKQIKARELWDEIIKLQIETGGPYILYKDSINKKSNQKNIGIVKSSNLCAEITEVSDDTTTSSCNLASICLPNFVVNKKFDFEEFGKVLGTIVENLNIVIDINKYPTEKARKTNLAHRPIGIGVQGLADVFMMMGMTFESQEARDLNLEIFEYMYYFTLKKSMELARDTEPYEFFKGSPISKGQFQFEMWGIKPKYTASLFEDLRSDVIKYGVKNSLLIALMPTASTSQIFGVNSCFEPIVSNVYVRRTLSGEYTIINHHLIQELKELGLSGNEVMAKIISGGGSIQDINEIPIDIRNKYKTAYELKQRSIIDLAADRAPFVCQSQSMNLFFAETTYDKLTNAHFYGWKRGLKTGSYYIRTKPIIKAQKIQHSVVSKVEKPKMECTDEVCTMCSS
jgi:ribonucleoside-diphosphate reductase alpha subunit